MCDMGKMSISPLARLTLGCFKGPLELRETPSSLSPMTLSSGTSAEREIIGEVSFSIQFYLLWLIFQIGGQYSSWRVDWGGGGWWPVGQSAR